ncbi:DUF1707 domain-containing protein [Stomatohabitans albus]|uniref:DUF1707 domain-containing protein n=1 Tax=Stomatohabitans albus TaxID=3110766 RepID=UPI00300D0A39
MTGFEPINDDERAQAVRALGIHYEQGTIDRQTYTRRCDLARESMTSKGLASLFVDLPFPHHDTDLTAPELAPVLPTTRLRPRDILDDRIGNTSLTHRKMRIIAWVLAILWMTLGYATIDGIVPEALELGVVFMPALLALLYTVALRPVRPKYRVLPVAMVNDEGE